jgi:hypothetical protein
LAWILPRRKVAGWKRSFRAALLQKRRAAAR